MVRAYRKGDTEAALKALREWWNSGTESVSWSRLQTISQATKAAAFVGSAPPPISADEIGSAVMLHTEAGVEAFDAGNAPRGTEHIGRAVVLRGGFTGLIDAEVRDPKPDSAPRFTRQAWFKAWRKSFTAAGRWRRPMPSSTPAWSRCDSLTPRFRLPLVR
jgi:hypothetical protein